MSKGDTFENDFLKLIFNGVNITGIANNPTTTPTELLYVSLHTADVGETGNQSTNETTYTPYARIGVRRCNADGTSSVSGWTVTNNSVSPVNAIQFAECTAGTASITHFAVGTAATGTGKVLYKGQLNQAIAIAVGVTPRLTTSSTITED